MQYSHHFLKYSIALCVANFLVRLKEDEGVINRCGFNSDGLRVVQQRLKKRQLSPRVGRAGLLGINVGKNKLQEVGSCLNSTCYRFPVAMGEASGVSKGVLFLPVSMA